VALQKAFPVHSLAARHLLGMQSPLLPAMCMQRRMQNQQTMKIQQEVKRHSHTFTAPSASQRHDQHQGQDLQGQDQSGWVSTQSLQRRRARYIPACTAGTNQPVLRERCSA
jgi:hypothetical protein